MTAAAQMTVKVREYASAWVEREEWRTGSRMTAYQCVASKVGASPEWLRKFIADRGEAKQPPWNVGWNIIAHYERIRDRVEANNGRKRARIAALKGKRYAADQSSGRWSYFIHPRDNRAAETVEREEARADTIPPDVSRRAADGDETT